MQPYMQILREFLPNVPDNIELPEMSEQEYEEFQMDTYNRKIGTLDKDDGIDCPICKNKGIIYSMREGNLFARNCECMKKRRSINAVEASNLGRLLKYNFTNFYIYEKWQSKAKEMAMSFASSHDNAWLYFGGQSGCGKSHLCSAVCQSLISQGRIVKYVSWDKYISHKMDAYKFKDEEYESFIDTLTSVDVLYIDDFLKTPTNKACVPYSPDLNEVRKAYTIINCRDLAHKKTILSSEHFLKEYEDYDYATAGRIKLNASCIIQIERSPDRDYRKKAKQREGVIE